MNNATFQAMKKKVPLILLMYFLACPFFRWYQLKNELLFDGSLTEGAFMHRVLLLLALTFIAGFCLIVYGLKNIPEHKNCLSGKPLSKLAQFAAAILLLLGNGSRALAGMDTTGAYTEVSATLMNVLPYLGIWSGLCIILFANKSRKGETPSPLLYMAVSIYLVIRLIVWFQEWNMDPSIHDYAYKLLAAIFTMLGCFQISGFCFNKGKRRITTLWCLCSAFFCAISIPDYLSTDLSELMITCAFLLLTLTFALELLYAPDPVEMPSVEEAPAELPE